jgi:sec-independent protein translocase protein TatA
MGAISPMHLILILAVALLVIGPGKLPETGAALGKAMREFRDAMNGVEPTPTSATAIDPEPAAIASPGSVDPSPEPAATSDVATGGEEA